MGDCAVGWTKEDQWFDFRAVLFSKACGENLGPTKWVPAGLSPPSSAEFKNEWSYTSTSPYAFIACTGTTLLHPIYLFCCNSPVYVIILKRRTTYNLLTRHAVNFKVMEKYLCNKNQQNAQPAIDQTAYMTA